MVNYIGSTGSIIHMAANTRSPRWACRPNSNLVPCVAESTMTDCPVTCGNCNKVVARAKALAYAMLDATAEGRLEAEQHVTSDIKRGHVGIWATAPAIRQSIRASVGSVTHWFNQGDVQAVNSAAYVLRRRELELAHLGQLAAAAELEAHSMLGGIPVCRPNCALVHDIATAELEAFKINPPNVVFEIGLGQDLKLHTREVPADLEQLWDAALVMNRELDLAKDEVFERPEITTPGSILAWNDEELADWVARNRRFAQRSINRGDVAEAAEFWFSMWSARREQAYRAQLLPEGHVFH